MTLLESIAGFKSLFVLPSDIDGGDVGGNVVIFTYFIDLGAADSIVFTKDLSDIRVTRLPGAASFECELNRANLPVTWYKDGEPIRKNPRIIVDCEGRTHRLTVKNIESADEGTYSCTTKNAKTAAKLTVQSKSVVYESVGC